MRRKSIPKMSPILLLLVSIQILLQLNLRRLLCRRRGIWRELIQSTKIQIQIRSWMNENKKSTTEKRRGWRGKTVMQIFPYSCIIPNPIFRSMLISPACWNSNFNEVDPIGLFCTANWMHHETIRIPKNSSFWASPNSDFCQTCLGFPFLWCLFQEPPDGATVDTSVPTRTAPVPRRYTPRQKLWSIHVHEVMSIVEIGFAKKIWSSTVWTGIYWSSSKLIRKKVHHSNLRIPIIYIYIFVWLFFLQKQPIISKFKSIIY